MTRDNTGEGEESGSGFLEDPAIEYMWRAQQAILKHWEYWAFSMQQWFNIWLAKSIVWE